MTRSPACQLGIRDKDDIAGKLVLEADGSLLNKVFPFDPYQRIAGDSPLIRHHFGDYWWRHRRNSVTAMGIEKTIIIEYRYFKRTGF